jgi:hypothetical protein
VAVLFKQWLEDVHVVVVRAEEFDEGFLEDEALALRTPAEDMVVAADAIDSGLRGQSPPATAVNELEQLGSDKLSLGIQARAIFLGAALGPGYHVQFARYVAAEECVDILLINGVAPQSTSNCRGNMERRTITVDLTESRGSSITPSTVGEIIPGCLSTKRTEALGNLKSRSTARRHRWQTSASCECLMHGVLGRAVRRDLVDDDSVVGLGVDG